MSKAAASPAPAETRLADYRPPAFRVESVELDVDIRDKGVRVRSRLAVRRNPAAGTPKAPLFLNGEAIRLHALRVDGAKLKPPAYALDAHGLTIPGLGDSAIIEIENGCDPWKNTALSGLYAAGPMLCTQCEAEGFRRFTFYPDRPDVMARFRVTIRADRKRFPVLLSNGNRLAAGREGKTRHWVRWEDPFPKPCYLFALVAGRLERVTDHFTTKDRRKVRLEIYVEPGRRKETGFAMEALKKAMRWDEKTYGLAYDLDLYMIVAVSFFNMGAMENKGLNIFNDACVLGRPDTATDGAIAFIERVVGHEYFHNWTGNRITCRDWFQLSLKEGLTVFREEEFCGAQHGAALERLMTVQSLRRAQFAEDSGAMAHPVRPASYQTIDNFYTATVYHKGAEVVRMIQTMAGRDGFRKGLSLYVRRHDGQAATCEDFVAAMADANNLDLKPFFLWYDQAGTPVLKTTGRYDAKARTYTLRVEQSCPPTPGQPTKRPLHIPLAVGLLGPDGKDLIGTRVLDVRAASETFVFDNIPARPVPSLLRNFSAPVCLESGLAEEELLFLMAKDSDPFNRWEAAQKIFRTHLLDGKALPAAFLESLRAVLRDRRMDEATRALTLTPPAESEIGLALKAAGRPIDPLRVYEDRQTALRTMAQTLADDLRKTEAKIAATLDEKASDGKARGQRSLKNLCLLLRAKTDPEACAAQAARQARTARNMTDRIAGLGVLADMDAPERDAAFAFFARRFGAQPTIMDNWLAAQAGARRPGVLKDTRALLKHPAFALNNPNRVSALLGSFAGNPLGFHAADGSGYRFIAEILPKLDRLNPQAAARLARPFLRWRDFDPARQKRMKATLDALAAEKRLSVNLREIVTKSLADPA